jgi:proteasome lid subunit RPN8/RPN11
MTTSLRLAQSHWDTLRRHLFPGDGKEAVAIALCGRRNGSPIHVLTIHAVIPIPYEECKVRTPDFIQWSSQRLVDQLGKAKDNGWAILKIHSHPGGLADFSETDDRSDADLFTSISVWTETDLPHASAIMLPSGEIFGRIQRPDGSWEDLESVSVAGPDFLRWTRAHPGEATPEFARRHAQVFGAGTTELMHGLTVGVIGCSGTGSPVIEQLARLRVKKLILVDPDVIEEKNLGRIVASGMDDAHHTRAKVDVLARNIIAMGLGTEVVKIRARLDTAETVKAVAECDVVFGCMDGVEGRNALNRLAACYLIPYIDVGVKLVADGKGGVSEACGAVHVYLPGGQTLMERKVFTAERLRAEGLWRTDPEAYARERKAGYIDGVDENRPAVVSINFFMASTAVNELLARLHPYRLDGNEDFAIIRYSFMQGVMYHGPEEPGGAAYTRILGKGDMQPLLDMPALSDA